MPQRKKCTTCGKYLIAFQNQWLHPDTPCSGVKDCIQIEGEVNDEFLYKKFIGLYGTPTINDYEHVTLLLKHKKLLTEKIEKDRLTIKAYEKVLGIWLVKKALKIYEFLNRR